MLQRKYHLLLVVLFMSIFSAKMVISGAPVFFAAMDKGLVNAVIMQLEQENHGDDTTKDNVKFADTKLVLHRYDFHYQPLLTSKRIVNRFIDHSRRYVDPYHPSVPTPPPNFS